MVPIEFFFSYYYYYVLFIRTRTERDCDASVCLQPVRNECKNIAVLSTTMYAYIYATIRI